MSDSRRRQPIIGTASHRDDAHRENVFHGIVMHERDAYAKAHANDCPSCGRRLGCNYDPIDDDWLDGEGAL